MNRIILAVLAVSLFSVRATGQEADSLPRQPGADPIESGVEPIESSTDRIESVSDPIESSADRIESVSDPIESSVDRIDLVTDTLKHGADAAGYVPLWESDTVSKHHRAPRVQGKTVVVEPDFSHSPSRAIIYSLVLPGLGQGYNKKFYKMPIVWIALGGAGYAISYNTRQYQVYSKEYALNPDDTNERYLRFWRRNMELSYIAMIAVYALQVVDAYVDAQLYSWNVNDDLSMGISPSLQPLMAPGSLTGHAYGLTCSFNLRR